MYICELLKSKVMRICKKCGASNSSILKKCKKCGSPLVKSENPTFKQLKPIACVYGPPAELDELLDW